MIITRIGGPVIRTKLLRRGACTSNSARTSSGFGGVLAFPLVVGGHHHHQQHHSGFFTSRTIFTSDNNNNNNGGGGGDDDDPHALFKEQMEMLKKEREELYGFTEDEQIAWSNVNVGDNNKQDGGVFNDHSKLPSSLMQSIEQARAEQQQQQQQQDDDPNFLSSDDDTTTTTTISSSTTTRTKSISNNNNNEDNDNNNNNYQPSHGMTHLTEDGNSVHMVDVGNKTTTKRIARAETKIILPLEVLDALLLLDNNNNNNNNDNNRKEEKELVGPKGPIFATAKIAGIMAAKKTSDLIPLCHPLPLDKVQIDIAFNDQNVIIISCECRVTHKTGVEMEALTGASVAALTIYDMLKALSHNIRIEQTILVSKSGGKRTVG